MATQMWSLRRRQDAHQPPTQAWKFNKFERWLWRTNEWSSMMWHLWKLVVVLHTKPPRYFFPLKLYEMDNQESLQKCIGAIVWRFVNAYSIATTIKVKFIQESREKGPESLNQNLKGRLWGGNTRDRQRKRSRFNFPQKKKFANRF